jgi:hypothetical protein
MPRRASSGINPGLLIGIAIIVAMALLGGKLLIGRKADGFTGVGGLDVKAFLENANSMRGNEYSVAGTIDEKLRWTPDHGQVVSVKVETEGSSELIPIEIPPEFNQLNIEREQRYLFKIRIRQGGIPVATAINRL